MLVVLEVFPGSQIVLRCFGGLPLSLTSPLRIHAQRAALVLSHCGNLRSGAFCTNVSTSSAGVYRLRTCHDGHAPLIVVAVLITVVVGLSSYGDTYLQSASGILGARSPSRRITRRHLRLSSRRQRPVADLGHERIKRRPVLGGLINEYERVA